MKKTASAFRVYICDINNVPSFLGMLRFELAVIFISTNGFFSLLKRTEKLWKMSNIPLCLEGDYF